MLLTDGESNSGMAAGSFEQYVKQNETIVLVFSIMFGDAFSEHFEAISVLTKSRVSDGRTDMIEAFKQVRGYDCEI